MTPARDKAPLDGGVGWVERGLRGAAVAAFAVFALWSGWAFLTYQHGPEARYFLDPAAHPNSILIQATLGEYLETFDPWRGWDAVPLRALGLWLAVLAGLWLVADGVTRPAGRRDLRPLTFALLLGAAGSLIATFRLVGCDSLGVVGVLAAPPRLGRLFPQRCPEPWGTLYIDTDGWVRPCCRVLWIGLGNIMEQDAGAIWNGRHCRRLRQTIHTDAPPDFCRACGLPQGITGGNVRHVEALAAQGITLAPAPEVGVRHPRDRDSLDATAI